MEIQQQENTKKPGLIKYITFSFVISITISAISGFIMELHKLDFFSTIKYFAELTVYALIFISPFVYMFYCARKIFLLRAQEETYGKIIIRSFWVTILFAVILSIFMSLTCSSGHCTSALVPYYAIGYFFILAIFSCIISFIS
jgi:hypothetical protein